MSNLEIPTQKSENHKLELKLETWNTDGQDGFIEVEREAKIRSEQRQLRPYWIVSLFFRTKN